MSENIGSVWLVRCTECGFWARFNEKVGLCRRRAPRPDAGNERDTVAHWPETYAEEGCGDGRVKPAGDARAMLACAECAVWVQGGAAQGGLEPMNYNDQTRAWWQHAGRCMRHAPVPLANPGARLVWPATHATDGCGEVAPRGPVAQPFLQKSPPASGEGA